MSKGSSPRPYSVSQETFGNNFDAIFGKKKQATSCNNCYNCTRDNDHMIVCAQCGNKRCPHGTDHNLACTNSNEPGQPGSRY
jgi:Zn finger protein HypA/HybF involved in hydrogenase expression